MDLHVRLTADGARIVEVVGTLDLVSAPELTALVESLMGQGIDRFILDLEKLESIDSYAIDALLRLFSRIEQRDMKLCLANLFGTPKKVLALTKLNEYFPIADSIHEATARVALS